MNVDSLVRLMEDGEYQKCLRIAERQLVRGGISRAELAKLNLVICRCRLGLNDPYPAVNSGLLAVKLARDVGEWDTLGRALLNLGTALVATRKYDGALTHLYSYFEHIHRYRTSRRFEGAIWRTIGIAHQRKLETDLAVDALDRARRWFAKHGVDRSAFNCLHDLVSTHLQVREKDPEAPLEPVEELLQAEKELAQKHAGESFYQATYLQDRAAYYLHANRLARAMVCAMKAMEIRKGDRLLNFHCHMVLHEATKRLGDAKQALGYALAARTEAIQSRHFELEFIAAQAMAEVVRSQRPEVVRELDREYQEMGIDLGQYLSPSILHRMN